MRPQSSLTRRVAWGLDVAGAGRRSPALVKPSACARMSGSASAQMKMRMAIPAAYSLTSTVWSSGRVSIAAE
jgi:hypothetical protein